MAQNIKIQKQSMRAEMKNIISHATTGAATRCAVRFMDTSEFNDATLLLTFISTPDEIPTTEIIKKAWDGGKRVAAPRIRGNELDFRLLTAGQMPDERDRFGILQPSERAECVQFADITELNILVAVPGLAFDLSGNRLGKGKGFYDRFLSTLLTYNPGSVCMALCLECQLVSSVPVSDHDQKIHAVCTEDRIIRP